MPPFGTRIGPVAVVENSVLRRKVCRVWIEPCIDVLGIGMMQLRQGMTEVDHPQLRLRCQDHIPPDPNNYMGRQAPARRIVLGKHRGVLARLSLKNHRICCLRFHHANYRYIWWE
jgi:hypothetical protein